MLFLRENYLVDDKYICKTSDPFANFRGHRGVNTAASFSQKSITNLRHILDNSGVVWRQFITLTYTPSRYPLDIVRVKSQLRSFLNFFAGTTATIYSAGYGARYIWVQELQKNGRLHFHILFDMTFPAGLVSAVWIWAQRPSVHCFDYLRGFMELPSKGNRDFQSYTRGYQGGIYSDMLPNTNCKPVKAWWGVLGYMTKYLSKSKGKGGNYGRWWGYSRCIKPLPLSREFISEGEFIQNYLTAGADLPVELSEGGVVIPKFHYRSFRKRRD